MMRSTSVMYVVLAMAVLVALPLFTSAPTVDASVANSVVNSYLVRTGVEFKVNSKDANEFIVKKRTGLKRADLIELYVYNDAKNDELRLRAYPLVNDKYLALSASGNQTALMKAMLQKNATAFGAYFIDNEGDIGFRYVFTTESGIGYEAFKVVVFELLRIADEAVVGLYNEYR